jgi:CRISPR-associated protein Cas1
LSITTKENQVILKNGKHFYEKEHEIESYFPKKFPYERLVISGKGMLSTESIKALSKNNVNVILTDSFGSLVSSINLPMVSGIGSRNRMNQYDTFREEFKVTYLQRQLLHSKFQSQINFLSTLENDCAKIPNYSSRKLVSLEAQASREYFKLYATFFDEKYQFDTRNSISKTKQDASDVINALLNYGYSVLASEIPKHLNGIGLDPYY